MSWWYDDPEEVEKRVQESIEAYEQKLEDFCKRKAAERRANPGRFERRMIDVLVRHDIQFEQEKPMDGYIVDFFLPVMNRIVEIDGRHHCTNANQRQSDTQRDAHFLRKGIPTIRIPNSEMSCVERLSKEALLERLNKNA